jgi:hypothetical protein
MNQADETPADIAESNEAEIEGANTSGSWARREMAAVILNRFEYICPESGAISQFSNSEENRGDQPLDARI